MIKQYQPLFLKYRPQAISELIGQQQISATLANAIKYNRISHAYLFTGPRGTGKTSAARIFAKSLNCEIGPTAEPCQKCNSCVEIKQGISPSVFEIDAASNNSVDDARLLIERAPLSACGGRFKLYIIDECHMLTKEAFNALLKTIEEPPANVIFILATTEEHKVLPTIVSRCQKLIFRLINDQALLEHLTVIADKENIIIQEEALKAIGNRANGGLRDALSLLDQISLLGGEGQAISTQDVLLLAGALPEEILNMITGHIFKGQGQEVLLLLKELFASGREAHLIASELARYMLNVAKAAYEQKQSEQKSNYAALAELIDQSELVQMIEDVDRLEVSCRRSSQPIMNLEIGLLSLCQRLDIMQWKTMETRLQNLEEALANIQKPETKTDAGKLDNKEIKEIKKVDVNSQAKEIIEKLTDNSLIAAQEINTNKDSKTEQPEVMALSEPDLVERNEQDEITEEPIRSRVGQNIDLAWQNILSELQKRHLPTFSLVSTHAFPIEITDKVLTVGVFVENFQKMIENKVEYIKTAAIACDFDQNLRVVVRVQADTQTASAGQKKNGLVEPNFMTANATIFALQANNDEQGLPITANVSFRPDETEKEHRSVKEAYRLFEGPGSRYIAPNQ